MSQERLMMTDELYDYLYAVSDREAPVLAELRAETRKDPRFNMQMTPNQAQFMQTLVLATGAKRILEVGTFTGYSALAMALVLPPDGRLVTLDISEEWTRLARRFWDKAGVADKIELRLAPAVQSMDALIAEGQEGGFDIVFIDADKPNYPEYWERGLKLARQGGLVIADNTLFQGVVGPSFTDERLRQKWADRPKAVQEELIAATHAARAFAKKIHKDPRVQLSMIPAGDGITLAVKL
ncbi:MAG TPA: class I SAM-dependent methyltransferase [Alphaproteobacteria bacterium]|jgi:caffeoyl-CoA O-methyltransferase